MTANFSPSSIGVGEGQTSYPGNVLPIVITGSEGEIRVRRLKCCQTGSTLKTHPAVSLLGANLGSRRRQTWRT